MSMQQEIENGDTMKMGSHKKVALQLLLKREDEKIHKILHVPSRKVSNL